MCAIEKEKKRNKQTGEKESAYRRIYVSFLDDYLLHT
jgi:hypothetical protein